MSSSSSSSPSLDDIKKAFEAASNNGQLSDIVRTVSQAANNSTSVAAALRYVKAASNAPRRAQSYLVGLSDDCPAQDAQIDTIRPLLAAVGVTVQSGFNIQGVRGLKVRFTGPALPLDMLARVPCVAYIEDDLSIIQQQVPSSSPFAKSANACLQSPAMQSSQSLWGLDALDGKLDDKYGFDLTGEGVNVYVVDSGINVRHPEYEGRATNIFTADTVKNQEQDDCTGHGSHVAGLIGGKTVGVAKRANLFGLRIIDCGKTGSVSDAVEALNFLSTNMKMPAVINLSLGSTESLRGDTLPRALNALARRGASVVIAAGNSEREVCDTSAPSMTTVPNTFVVGALDRPSAQELARDNYNPRRAKFSNFGNCVRWWAPGVDMWSTANSTIDVQGNRLAFESRQGTSQAAPLVAGVLAHHLQANPSLTPSELQARLARDAKPLKQISDTAMHVFVPRAADVGAAAAYARTEQAVMDFPLSRCEANNSGVITAFASALGTSRNTVTVALSATGAVLLLVLVAAFVKVRHNRRRKQQMTSMMVTSDSAGKMGVPGMAVGGGHMRQHSPAQHHYHGHGSV